MNVRIHAGLDQAYQVFRLVAPILTCGGIALIAAWQSSAEARLALVAAAMIFVGLTLAWLVLPVECNRDGCPGRMSRTAERISFWTVRTVYRCDQCGALSPVEIFNPNFVITAGDY